MNKSLPVVLLAALPCATGCNKPPLPTTRPSSRLPNADEVITVFVPQASPEK